MACKLGAQAFVISRSLASFILLEVNCLRVLVLVGIVFAKGSLARSALRCMHKFSPPTARVGLEEHNGCDVVSIILSGKYWRQAWAKRKNGDFSQTMPVNYLSSVWILAYEGKCRLRIKQMLNPTQCENNRRIQNMVDRSSNLPTLQTHSVQKA